MFFDKFGTEELTLLAKSLAKYLRDNIFPFSFSKKKNANGLWKKILFLEKL